MPRLPFIPNLNLYIVTCIDPRVDPAQILGVRLGEAVVQRDIGGRITPAVIADIAYIGYLVDTKAPEGPYFEVAIIHHTDCGSTLLADDELRHGFAQRIGVDERSLADTPALDPARSVTDRRRAGAVGGGGPAERPRLRARLRRRHRPGDHHRGREKQEVRPKEGAPRNALAEKIRMAASHCVRAGATGRSGERGTCTRG